MPTSTTYVQFEQLARDAWNAAHPPSYVRPNSVPESFGDKIEVLSKVSGGEVYESAVSDIPWVIVDNMPASKYPQYMEFFLRATMAWIRTEDPAIHDAIAPGASMSTLVPITAIRCGMVHSVGVPSEQVRSPLSDFVHFDVKRSNLWITQASSDPKFCRWLSSMSRTPSVPSSTLEVLLAWCSVAPLVGCMASSMEYSMGMSYSVPFVQRSISQHMLTNMRPASYAAAGLGQPLTWDSAMQSALSGYTVSECASWASDALMALCSERRVQTDEASVEHSRARAAEVKKRARRREAMSPTSPAAVGALWNTVRHAARSTAAREDDQVTLATGLMTKAREPDVYPEESASNVHTAVPSRAPSPPAAMTRADVADIRAAATAAQQLPNGSRSLIMGANDEESVRW